MTTTSLPPTVSNPECTPWCTAHHEPDEYARQQCFVCASDTAKSGGIPIQMVRCLELDDATGHPVEVENGVLVDDRGPFTRAQVEQLVTVLRAAVPA